MWLRRNRTENTFIILVIFITSILYFHITYRNGLTTGIDSPYYMIQIREILRSGHMKYGDPPLIFYLLSGIIYLAGNIMLGFAYSISILMVIAALPFYFFIKRFLKSSLAASISLLAILYSPSYIHMVGDLVKNQFGIIFIGLVLIYLFKKKKSSYDYLYIFIFTLLSGLTHILDLGIVMLILSSYFLYSLVLRKRESIFIFIIISVITSIFLIGYYLMPFYFGDVSRGYNFIESLANPTHRSFRKSPPPNIIGKYYFSKSFNAPLHPITLSIYIPTVTILIVGLILLIYSIRNKTFYKSCFIFSTITLGFFLIFPWPTPWIHRLFIMSFLPTSLILGYIVSLIKEKSLIILVSLIILSYPVSNAITSIHEIHPTISHLEYLDLKNMKRYIDSYNGVVVFRERYKSYWVEYILDINVVPRVGATVGYEKIYYILPNNFGPPPNTILIYRGNIYSLFLRA